MSVRGIAEGFELPDPSVPDIEGVIFRREQGGLFGRTRSYVALGEFSGPYGLLLALIERDELDVRRVPLAGFADEFLRYFAEIPDDRLETLSSFVSVAAQLIVLKSRALLPRPISAIPNLENDLDVEDEADTLRIRLLRYRIFRDAARVLGDRLAQPLWYREPPTRQLPGPKAAPVEPIVPMQSDPKRLLRAMVRIALRRKPLAALSAAPVGMKVSIGERLAAILDAVRLNGVVGVDLETLLGDRQDRSFIAVTFLALLELSKRREVEVRQDALWGPITILQGVSE
ncbi:MAG: ScpA family protein [bacterium]